ncbi:MAG: hypothetical protein J7530_08405 [Novosphingobium sp.]|nr:hypothetical protein [Novosphingobium sp.]
MQVHEDLKALAQDEESWVLGQRELARTIAEWRALPHVAPVFTALERFGRGVELEVCRPLAALFEGNRDTAGALVSELVRRGVAAIGSFPLGQLPFRHARRETINTVLLAHAGTATLALAVYDGEALARDPPPLTAEFAPKQTWSRVLAGRGRGERILRDSSGTLHVEPVALEPGDALYRNGAREAFRLRNVDGSLVVLRLQRLASLHRPVRAYALEDGAFRGQAALTAEYNRQEMAMAVLAGLGRKDAVPVLSRIVEGTGSAALRWEALRAILAIDTRAGLVLLGTVAAGEDRELAGPARDLHRRLIAQWPELERVAQWRG